MSFVGLHIHSDYSLLDGASQIPQLVDRVSALGMPAVALTDHGVMYGAIELIKICKSKGVKPIIGNEMYVINGDITKQERRPRYHQVVLAKNTQGYKNLVKLTTLSHLQGVQGKGIFSRPCISKALIEQYHEGLVMTSACLGGEIPQALLQGRPEIARKVAQWYKDLLGEDYYLEIQDHGLPEERIVNPEIVRIAQELDIKLVVTNDSHYISCNDVEAHDALLCIQTGKLISEEKRLRYTGTEYLKSADEMRQLFRDHLPQEIVDRAIATTLEVAAKIEDYNILGEPRIPNYPIPTGLTAFAYMVEVAQAGMLERFNCKTYAEIAPHYRERLEYELNMLDRMGFATYFLVVWDYIKFARDHGIPVGPGRGSAAGSLVAYAMRITNIDPVHHGLLFERFLNPERRSMPDVDTDFCIERRDEVIQYVTEKYGADHVAQIITYNRMTSKAVLKDVARVLDVPYSEADKMAKMIPVVRGKPTKLAKMIAEDTPAPEFREKYQTDERVRHWLDMALRIEGTNKSVGIHAAGVVISAEPLDEIVPLQRNADGNVFTQYFMEDIESLGLLKMDFLGLKNLTMIQKAVELIQQTHQQEIDLDRLPLDDRNSYELLARGELEGIFQLESSGMRQIVRDLKPSGLEDISSVLALYRPGPLDAGLIPMFINRKHGREQVTYEHVLLEPILRETYGVLCLPQGTLINQPDGALIPIESVQAGDWVLTSSDGQKVHPARVAQQWQSGLKPIVKITLSSGTEIFASGNHRFLTAEGDKSASQLQAAQPYEIGYCPSDVLYEQWQISKNEHHLNPNEAYLLGLLLGSGGQHLPPQFVDFCECDRIDVLRGLWDGGGWYRDQLVYFRSASPGLLQQVATLLSSLKIAYFMADADVYVCDRKRFLAVLGAPSLPDESYRRDKSYSPISEQCLATQSFANRLEPALAAPIRATPQVCQSGLVCQPGLKRDTGWRSQNSEHSEFSEFLEFSAFLEYSQRLSDWDQVYQERYQATYLQDARPVYVVAVEPWGVAECFDLQMCDQTSPYFLAHGIVTHNCYQEQIMKMAQDLAGYTLGEADILRRAMGKKKPEEMQKQKSKFIDGSQNNGIDESISKKLFEQMENFAAYCFNKSHSVAYGYVTYQTAYLKANYPVEYMAALLTTNSDAQDKVQKYIATCQSLGIRIEPPDINRSGVDFTPLSDSILFGLSAVRNVGLGAIENILQARESGGAFKSLADLCDRIDPRTVNRRALEALIQCGALDTLQANRRQLTADLDYVLDWAQSRARDREVGQGNLFDLMGGLGNSGNAAHPGSGFESAPKAPTVPDYPPQEKLKLEKELLGFYISDHPLKAVQQAAQVLAPISLSGLAAKQEGTMVSAIAMISSIKPVTTKKGDRMAILTLEDLTGQADAVVFPKSFQRVEEYLQVDARLMIWGKVDKRDDRPPQLLVEDMEPVEAVRMIILDLTPDIARDSVHCDQLRNILREQHHNNEAEARIPIIAIVSGGDRREIVRLGKQFCVIDQEAAVIALQQAGFQARPQSLVNV